MAPTRLQKNAGPAQVAQVDQWHARSGNRWNRGSIVNQCFLVE